MLILPFSQCIAMLSDLQRKSNIPTQTLSESESFAEAKKHSLESGKQFTVRPPVGRKFL